MAKYDVTIVKSAGGETREVDVEASATLIYAGEPVKKAGNYFIKLATGDPEIGTDEGFGIAQSDSTNTSTADGKVKVFFPVPGKSVMRTKATTSTNVNTAAKLLGLKNDAVAFDLTSTIFTLDEDEGDDPNVHGCVIVGGNINKGTLDFVIQPGVAYGGGTVGQTRD